MAMSNRRLTSKLAIGLFAAIAIDTLLQLVWKTTVLATADDATPLATLSSVFSNPAFFGVLFLMAIQFFNWLIVLSQADLSYVKPISSLSYASVSVFSAVALGEAIDGIEVMGLACVIAGVWLISQTQPMTSKSPKPQEVTPSIFPVAGSWARKGSHLQGHAN
jgi:drug/metabolite transporter (DMT)-like permease